MGSLMASLWCAAHERIDEMGVEGESDVEGGGDNGDSGRNRAGALTIISQARVPTGCAG